MEARVSSADIESHSSRNVFRRQLHGSDLKQFENDCLTAISALESKSPRHDVGQREYAFSANEENALENLFFPKNLLLIESHRHGSREANSDNYMHLSLPRVTVQMLLSHAHIKRVKTGKILNIQNQTACPLLVVLSGQCSGHFSSVGVDSNLPDELQPADFERTFGKEQANLNPGDIFGCEMFCHRASSSMTLIAKSSVVALMIDEKVLSILVQHWKRMESITLLEYRQLLETNPSQATRLITAVLQMQCTLGKSGLFAKKPKVSLKKDFSGCLLATIPAGVDVEQFLAETFRSSIHDMLPLNTQDCYISALEHVAGFVVLSGSFAAVGGRSFQCSFNESAKTITCLSILGPSSMVELKDPFFKTKCASDDELHIFAREKCDILLIHQDQVSCMAFRSWSSNPDSIELDKCAAVARRVIAIDDSGKHASTASMCTVGDIVALCQSEARKSFVESPQHDHLMNILIHQDCAAIVENVLTSQLSTVIFANRDSVKALASSVMVMIRMPVKVHPSHARKVFQAAISDTDLQTYCVIIVTGSCISQKTLLANSCGMRNPLAAELFSSMVNVPQDQTPKKLKSQDVFFIQSLSSLQRLSADFLSIAFSIRDIDTWADHFMSNWIFAQSATKIPCATSSETFYSNKDRLVAEDILIKKDAIPSEKQKQLHRVQTSKMTFAAATHTSKLKRASIDQSEFFDDLRIKNERSSRLKLRRKLRQLEIFEGTCKLIIDDKNVMIEHWARLDVNCSGTASLSELQNWLTMQFPENFKTPKAIHVAFHDTLKHFRIVTQGRINDNHFSYFIQKMTDFASADVVFDELDVDMNRKFSLSEFAHGMKKLGLEMNETHLGSDFQEMIDASGSEMTFTHFCNWFHRRNIKKLLFVENKKMLSGYSEISNSADTRIEGAGIAHPSNDIAHPINQDLEVEMCTILQLHPQFQLIPDRVALDFPFEILKVSKGAMILHGCSVPAPRLIYFVVEGVVASILPDSSCNPICLSAGNSVHQTVSSPWHKHRIACAFYCGSASIGNSNFFQGVGDGLEYMAATDVVLMVLRWRHVDLQWQQTMLMDLQSQNHAFDYFLWSKPSVIRSNYQQMQLLSSILNKQCDNSVDKSTLALLCCHSQLCETHSDSAIRAQSSPGVSPRIQTKLPVHKDFSLLSLDESAIHLADLKKQIEDEDTLVVMFQAQSLDNRTIETDVAINDSSSASHTSRTAIAFIVTGPAYVVIQGIGLSIMTESKQTADVSQGRRRTIVDPRRDSKRWHILPGHCAVVTSDQLASGCRGRINLSKEKNVSSMSCHADKRNLFHCHLLSAQILCQATTGSVAAVSDEVRIALVDLCCLNFLEHTSLCYSKHKCFTSNAISNFALSHAGTRTLKFFMGERLWTAGQEGIYVVLQGMLRVMFSFGEVQLKADSRNSGMSVSNHLVELLCLGPMSIFGEIGGSFADDVHGQVFVDCADAECELLFFSQQAVSCLSPKCQSDLKELLRSRSEMLKQSMLTHKDILHVGAFQKERMYIMNLAENESKRVQFLRDPKQYSQAQSGSDAPDSLGEISALRHFAASKYSLIQNSCFQSLNENVKECSANMASFYKTAGRRAQPNDSFEAEALQFEGRMSSLNILPLNSAPKLKRLLVKERVLQSQSPTRGMSDTPTLNDVIFDLPVAVAPIIPLKHVSDVQKRVDAKILKLKSDEQAMEIFKKRVTHILASLPGKSEMEKKNKDVSSYATPEARSLRLQTNAALTKQRCEKARIQKQALESSFKESTAKKLEEDEIRIQNHILAAENRLHQKNLTDFQMETLPVFAMVSRFRWFVKVFLNEVPKVRHLLQCTVKLQRCIRKHQSRQRTERKNRVHQRFRRAFRRFKMMYCLWAQTFALKMLLKFMREMKKARQVTFVIRSYMIKVKQIQAWWRIVRYPYNSRREMFRLLTRKIEAAMDAYKDETVLGHTKSKQAPKGKDKKAKPKKKKSSRPDTTENVREHVDRISNCVAMHIQLVGETGKSPVPLSELELLSCFRLWMRQLVPKHQAALKRFEEETREYEEAVRRIHFKKQAKNLFSAPKNTKDVGVESSATDFLSPPVRPTMKIIPSWDSVLCALEARLQLAFSQLEKW